MPRPLPHLLTALALLVALVPAAAAADDVCPAYPCDHAVTSFDGVEIMVTVFRPDAADDGPVPLLLEGHGWGGSRQTGTAVIGPFLDAGYGVLSIDQRGHGDSGGEANVFDPGIEGRDLMAILDFVTDELDWVARDVDAEGQPIPDDPRLGAVGMSYGGGFQFAAALAELAVSGETRLDALAPEITWHNLNDALAPNMVARTTWLTALFGLSAGGYGANRPAPYIGEAFVWGAATGTYPDGQGPIPGEPNLFDEFALHSPHGYLTRTAEYAARLGSDLTEPIKLDIPVLFGQAFNDNIFNLNQAWHTFHDLLTEDAQDQSTIVGYNFGHSLPNAYPVGDLSQLYEFYGGCVDAGILGAAGGQYQDVDDAPPFQVASIAFFDAVFDDDPATDPQVFDGNRYAFATTRADLSESDCLLFDEPAPMTSTAPLWVDPTGQLGPSTGTVTMAGAPVHLPLDGTTGVTIAGIPRLRAELYGLGLDQRVFVGLSRGHSPATAQVIQNNLLPIRNDGPLSIDGLAVDMELPGVSAVLGPAEQLYLTITPTSDQFAGHGSRTPGAIGLTDVSVDLPLMDAAG